jgi:hypothetical protein
MNPACMPDGGTPEGRQGSMTEKDSIATESGFELSYSVAKAFEPIKAWQDRGVAELAASLESLEPMEQSAAATLGPINALCEHMRKLSNAFAPLRTFEEQLGVLAESFAPMKAMHQEIALMVEDSGALFIQLAKSLEVVTYHGNGSRNWRALWKPRPRFKLNSMNWLRRSIELLQERQRPFKTPHKKSV